MTQSHISAGAVRIGLRRAMSDARTLQVYKDGGRQSGDRTLCMVSGATLARCMS